MAPRIPDDVVREGFAQGKSDADIAAGYSGADAHYVFRRRMLLDLKKPRGGKRAPRGDGKSSRHGSHALEGRPSSLPAVDNAALIEARTIYPSTVVSADGLLNLLVAGKNSKKIGGMIRKGPARGFPIFTLTLEERATCPTSCRHWRSCYGNNMHLAKRIRNDAAFEERLEAELAVLQSRYPRGFAIRLHVLGDFYSVEYVRLWERFLVRFKSMFVFGFSARWDSSDPIGQELVRLVLREWGRFSIRFSNAPVDECSTVSIEHPIQKPDDAIICPAQTGKTESCGTCGLCWNSRRRIAFLQHAIVAMIGGWAWLASTVI
jgi:hypothetical protein